MRLPPRAPRFRADIQGLRAVAVGSVVLFGDSHAAECFPPLDALAQKGEIYLQADTKSSCPAIIRSVLVYRHGTHVTATFARTMADVFDREQQPLLAAK